MTLAGLISGPANVSINHLILALRPSPVHTTKGFIVLALLGGFEHPKIEKKPIVPHVRANYKRPFAGRRGAWRCQVSRWDMARRLRIPPIFHKMLAVFVKSD
jgi:hypothetical protein